MSRYGKSAGKKRYWVPLILALLGYQALSPDGVGAKWGVPSIDTFYKEPRDVLISRVEAANEVQKEAVEEFRTALEEFKLVTGFEGGDLEVKFNTLNASFEQSEAAAEEITHRVDQVVAATNRLLNEWREELDQYHDAKFKQRAESQFDDTRSRAEKLIAAMRAAEQKTQPVLDAFRDQVLFLKHNLNMKAISTLQAEGAEIEQDVSALIRDMEASISEAEVFIKALDR